MKIAKLSYVSRGKLVSLNIPAEYDLKRGIAKEVYSRLTIPNGGIRVDILDNKNRTSFTFTFFKRSR